MPDDFTNMWNLKNKMNKHNRNRLIDTKNILTVPRWEGIGRKWVKMVKGLIGTDW